MEIPCSNMEPTCHPLFPFLPRVKKKKCSRGAGTPKVGELTAGAPGPPRPRPRLASGGRHFRGRCASEAGEDAAYEVALPLHVRSWSAGSHMESRLVRSRGLRD